MVYKEIISAVAITITFVAFLPYIRSILSGKIKPHVFSWVIWGTTTFIVFLAQLAENAGVGAWPIGVSGIITIYIAFIAYIKRADISITQMDWVFLVVAFTALPFWYLTADPLWAVIILTTVDVLGFGPTMRKAYNFPQDEQLSFFALFIIRNVIVVLALENYSITTVLFPAVIAMACLVLIAMVIYRRQVISR